MCIIKINTLQNNFFFASINKNLYINFFYTTNFIFIIRNIHLNKSVSQNLLQWIIFFYNLKLQFSVNIKLFCLAETNKMNGRVNEYVPLQEIISIKFDKEFYIKYNWLTRSINLITTCFFLYF